MLLWWHFLNESGALKIAKQHGQEQVHHDDVAKEDKSDEVGARLQGIFSTPAVIEDLIPALPNKDLENWNERVVDVVKVAARHLHGFQLLNGRNVALQYIPILVEEKSSCKKLHAQQTVHIQEYEEKHEEVANHSQRERNAVK